MNIIVKGKLNKPLKPKMFQCDKCGCIFDADGKEYIAAGGRYHSTCPTDGCGNKVYAIFNSNSEDIIMEQIKFIKNVLREKNTVI